MQYVRGHAKTIPACVIAVRSRGQVIFSVYLKFREISRGAAHRPFGSHRSSHLKSTCEKAFGVKKRPNLRFDEMGLDEGAVIPANQA